VSCSSTVAPSQKRTLSHNQFVIQMHSAHNIEAQLLQQTRLQEMLMDIASTYISMPVDCLNQSIETTLGAMGKFVDADRVYIFAYDFESNTCSNTYEWCAQGIVPQMHSLQQIPIDTVPDWLSAHQVGRTIYIPDVLALPKEDGARRILEPQNIKSLIAVPMMQGQQCAGFVGFDSVRHHYNYSTAEQRLLVVFAQMLVNVFERRDTELALRQAKELAQASSKAKSEFLANMSHEIRTPLNAVIGFTDLLLSTPLSPTQQEYVTLANTSGQALLGIVNDILDLSKIEAYQLTLEWVDADVLDTIRQAMSVVQQAASQKGLALKLSMDQPHLLTMAKYDPVRMRQVLVNLLNNAVKFTEQGEVEVKLCLEPLGLDRSRFKVSVRDTGIGISPEQRPLLFKSFAQADNSTTRRFGGTGLGLAISRLLVEKMGGRIDFESTPGQGSTFWFEVELELAAPVEQPRAKSVAVANSATATVLVVEDVVANRLLIKALLRKLFPSVRILEAGNGQEALDLIVAEPVDLVLMDVHMPTMDGVEATRHIRMMGPPSGRLPIVAITASALEHERQRCLDSGMNDFLTKPIHPDVLSQVVGTYLH
jgi:signal transduction histidine kinase